MPLYSLSVCYQSFEVFLDQGKALQKAMRRKSKSVVKDTSRNDDIEVGLASNISPVIFNKDCILCNEAKS